MSVSLRPAATRPSPRSAGCPCSRLVAGLLLLLLAALVAGCGSSAIYQTYDYKKEYDPRLHEYVVGVGDTLQITVFHTPDLSGGGTVRPDGVITMPLIGDLPVAGKTPSQIREDMKARLATYIKDSTAVITVVVSGANSYRFTVAGNVARPGAQSPKYYVTVSEAIAAAGGLSKFASPDLIIIRPDGTGHIRQIPVNYDQIISGTRPEEDLPIVSGDTIFVP
jgi:polysaccharide biosynthesis/export protein